ncbi:MAG: PEP-CTERM sorting domain-containing protein [Verrucomicrobiota bacterium]
MKPFIIALAKPFAQPTARRSIAPTRLQDPVLRGVTLLALLFLVTSANTASAAVYILNAEYTTFVSASVGHWSPYPDPPVITQSETRKLVSNQPISDGVHLRGDGTYPPEGWAEATSGLLEVEAFTSAHKYSGGLGSASAWASNHLVFSPVAVENDVLTLQFQGMGRWSFSAGSAKLFDLTYGTEIWSYDWNYATGGNVVFDPYGTALINAPTEFLPEHQYDLSLYTQTYPGDDSQSMHIQVGGLALVPEPATGALLSLGALAMFMRRRLNP